MARAQPFIARVKRGKENSISDIAKVITRLNVANVALQA